MKLRKLIAFLPIIICFLNPVSSNAYTDELLSTYEEPEIFKVEATAYYNKYHNKCADGSEPEEGLTVAGKREWLGKTCVIYLCKEDGSIGEFLGYYEFRDTGFGNDLDGDGIGSIQEGTCIDIYMDEKEDCIEWGRKNVWIQVIEAEG